MGGEGLEAGLGHAGELRGADERLWSVGGWQSLVTLRIRLRDPVAGREVSQANTYVGLTTSLPGSAPGEPAKYYPTGQRTFLRIVPIDSIQAAADLMAMKNAGCTRVAVANDKEAYGAGLATLLGWRRATTASTSSATPGSTRRPAISAATRRR